ncbi:MAG: Hsp20/alpha crystallin family protein [Solirubrobacterales bacterium]
MALVRYGSGRGSDPLQTDLNRVFDAVFATRTGDGNGAARRWVPAIDLAEDGGQLVLRADLPGLTEEDVEVEVADGVLTVSGERKAGEKKEGEGYYRVERAFGRFSRSLSLPKGIDADRVTAEFDNGVLEVRIPKPEERKPHRIEIGAASVEGTGTEK